MGTSLIGLLPQNTYSGLIKVGNNTALNTTLKTLSDGAGNDLPMQASTTGINFTGTVSGVASGVAGAIQFSNGSAFASDAANLFWDNVNKRWGLGTNAPAYTFDLQSTSADPLRVKTTASYFRAIFQNSGASGIFDFNSSSFQFPTNNVEFGTSSSLGARVGIKGSGSTSATTSLLVQNSGGVNNATFRDNGEVSLIQDRTGKGLQLIDNLATSQSTSYYQRGGVAEVTTSSAGLNYFWWANNNGSWPTGVFAYNNGVFIVSSTQKNLDAASSASAVLQADSTTRGFLPPRMTTTQKNAIASPAAGLEMYDSTAKSPAYYDGTNWGYTGGALQNASGNSGTLNISFAAGNIVNLTLNATTTLAFSNAVIGTYIIQVTQAATGSNSLAYPASVKWAGGTPPTLSTAVGKTDILTFYYDGTFYYGTYSLNY